MFNVFMFYKICHEYITTFSENWCGDSLLLLPSITLFELCNNKILLESNSKKSFVQINTILASFIICFNLRIMKSWGKD